MMTPRGAMHTCRGSWDGTSHCLETPRRGQQEGHKRQQTSSQACWPQGVGGSFEGVCLTHVILAPGTCGGGVRAAVPDTASAGSRGQPRAAAGEFREAWSCAQARYLRALDPPPKRSIPQKLCAGAVLESGSGYRKVSVFWLTFFSPLDLREEISAQFRREITRTDVPRLFGFGQNRENWWIMVTILPLENIWPISGEKICP